MTRGAFHIEVEPAKLLTSRQELAVLREAYRHQPASSLLRGKLATALLMEDRFSDAISVLDGTGKPDVAECSILVQAHLACETSEDNQRVVALVDQLMPDLDDDETRAQFLADQAKAYRRLGQTDTARQILEHALRLDPENKDACKRLAAIDLETGQTSATLDMLDRLEAQGASHARLHAARALVHARAGRIDASRQAVAFDDLHYAGMLATPPGMTSLAAFNAALAAELLGHPGLRYERYGTASEQTWRIDHPLVGDAPMTRLLLDQVARDAERHVARIAGHDHAWLRQRPDRGMLHCWCVMTDGTGYETWHVHQFGWMSGVYYVQIPPAITAGDDEAGCIAFGLPEDLTGDEAAADYGTRIVRPQEGMLMLFPSHSYHRTFPHRAAERRICVAFDIWPAA